MKKRVAIVLFNLGGPDSQEAVQPFLYNLFKDPAILGVPNPMRWLLAKLISSRRTPTAQHIYQLMGGGSPLLPLTREQSAALKTALPDWETETFICMRYWHPMADEAAMHVKDFNPDAVIALPLYPQFSTTTTGSSFKDWQRAAKRIGLNVPTHYVCCYPTEPDFIAAHAELIAPVYQKMLREHGKARILFSAHGLPEVVVKRGDPYQWQVEKTTQAVLAKMNLPGVDCVNSYQSRVGPLQWIKPATDEEIKRAGTENMPLVVVPIAFVSEHSETLVELDIEYGKLAEEAGVPAYARIPALGVHPSYIASLAQICRDALNKPDIAPAETPGRYCDRNWQKCPCKGKAA